MRIRSIKPEFYRSEDIAALNWDTRLIFIGLWSYVDDNGVGRDVEQLIVADLFPLEDDPRETLARVSRGLQALSEQGLIVRYTVESRPYLAICTWADHQRIDKPNKPRYPGPDQGILSDSRECRESVASSPRVEQGSRGTEEQGNRGSKDSSSEVAAAPIRHDVEALLDLLDTEIETNGGKAPTRSKKNRDAVRLMLDRDGRTVEQVEKAIRWCQADEFWRSNILSGSKLREKFDQLRLAASRSKQDATVRRVTAAERNLDTVAYFENERKGLTA